MQSMSQNLTCENVQGIPRNYPGNDAKVNLCEIMALEDVMGGREAFGIRQLRIEPMSGELLAVFHLNEHIFKRVDALLQYIDGILCAQIG